METEHERFIVTTADDLHTYLGNVRGDLNDAERARAVEALRSAVHPAWGSDWGQWLAEHHELVDEASDLRAHARRGMHRERLESLRSRAGQAGDADQVRLCDDALRGDADALATCLAVLREHENNAIDVWSWARGARVGDYLSVYWEGERDPGSRCGWSDSTLHEIREVLRARGLDVHADDIGLRVSEVSR